MTITIEVQNWKQVPSHLAAMYAVKETCQKLADGTLDVGGRITQNDYDFNGIEFTTTIKE